MHQRAAYISLMTAAAGVLFTVGMDAGFASAEDTHDNDIKFAVERSLSGDDMIPQDSIDVSTKRGIVTLTGTIPSIYANEQAIRHAQSIKRVCAVVNNLEVRTSKRTDGEVAQDVPRPCYTTPPRTPLS